MRPILALDFVSDVSCPWSAIGLQSFAAAMQRRADVWDGARRRKYGTPPQPTVVVSDRALCQWVAL